MVHLGIRYGMIQQTNAPHNLPNLRHRGAEMCGGVSAQHGLGLSYLTYDGSQ